MKAQTDLGFLEFTEVTIRRLQARFEGIGSDRLPEGFRDGGRG
jgi:hypothetical protein